MAELEAAGYLDAAPHQRRPRAHGPRLPAVRRVDRDAGAAGAGRAADDPPPVRPGGVRQRAVVPPRGGHAGRPDPRRRPGHAGQAGGRPAAPRRPRRERRPAGQPRPRAGRGAGQAGAAARSTVVAHQADLDAAALRLNAAHRSAAPARQLARQLPDWPLETDADRLAGSAPWHAHPWRPISEFDASAVEDVFSEGLLNVMAAPEFSESEKLRRVFARPPGPRVPGRRWCTA